MMPVCPFCQTHPHASDPRLCRSVQEAWRCPWNQGPGNRKLSQEDIDMLDRALRSSTTHVYDIEEVNDETLTRTEDRRRP